MLAIALTAAAVVSVPAWTMIGGIRDPYRGSSIAASAVGSTVFAGGVALCFLAAGGFALRSDRPLTRAGPLRLRESESEPAHVPE